MNDEYDNEQLDAIQRVVNVHEKNSAELSTLNKRLDELRNEFRDAYNANDLGYIFSEHEDSWDTNEYRDVVEIASEYGLGLSYETDYDLWQPSTTMC